MKALFSKVNDLQQCIKNIKDIFVANRELQEISFNYYTDEDDHQMQLFIDDISFNGGPVFSSHYDIDYTPDLIISEEEVDELYDNLHGLLIDTCNTEPEGMTITREILQIN